MEFKRIREDMEIVAKASIRTAEATKDIAEATAITAEASKDKAEATTKIANVAKAWTQFSTQMAIDEPLEKFNAVQVEADTSWVPRLPEERHAVLRYMDWANILALAANDLPARAAGAEVR